MQYTCACVNAFFRMLRDHGIWIPAAAARVIARCGQDWGETFSAYELFLVCSLCKSCHTSPSTVVPIGFPEVAGVNLYSRITSSYRFDPS